MYELLKQFHSGWAYLALVFLIVAVVNAAAGLFSKREFTAKDRKISILGLIGTHTQLLIGLILVLIFGR